MTQEEKSRNYDEAYKRVAIRFGSNVADEIFLKESEDERIRKDIIHYLEITNSQMTPNQDWDWKNRWLPWLEKQGERKPADKAVPFYEFEGLTDFERTLAVICIGWIGEELGWKQYIKDNAGVLLKIAVKKFNSIQDVPFEQKPTWSEEDNKIIEEIINDIECARAINYHAPKEGYEFRENWLKSLRPQNWTKEDKERYISCLQKLSTGNPEQSETINSKWFKEHVYPQSQWKPSDEQMKALNYYLKNDIDNDGVFGSQLVTLYQDLLKLRKK